MYRNQHGLHLSSVYSPDLGRVDIHIHHTKEAVIQSGKLSCTSSFIGRLKKEYAVANFEAWGSPPLVVVLFLSSLSGELHASDM